MRAGATEGFSAQNLLPVDRPEWSDLAGEPRSKEDPRLLPHGWAWRGEWRSVPCAPDGGGNVGSAAGWDAEYGGSVIAIQCKYTFYVLKYAYHLYF